MKMPERQVLKAVVTGVFDFDGFLRLADSLRVLGEVQSTYFDRASSNLSASATFMVDTDHCVDHLESTLAQVVGVENVLMETKEEYYAR